MSDKWITRIILTIASIMFFVLGAVSVGHTITMWDISNDGWYGSLLGGMTFLGIILSLLLALKSDIENMALTRSVIFILTVTMELIGNVYYNYTIIDVSSEAFMSFSNLTEPILKNAFIENYTFYVKSIMAISFGIWVPIMHIFSFIVIKNIVADNNQKEKVKEEQESETEEVKEEKLAISDKDKDFEIIKTLDNKKKILTNKREVKTWEQKQK